MKISYNNGMCSPVCSRSPIASSFHCTHNEPCVEYGVSRDGGSEGIGSEMRNIVGDDDRFRGRGDAMFGETLNEVSIPDL